MDMIPEDMKKPAVAAAAGAAGALVLALFAPAAVLLGVGAATVAGVYLYDKHKDKDGKDGSNEDDPIDVESMDIKKETK